MQVSQQKLAKASALWPDPSTKREGNRTLVCREHTLLRSYQMSKFVCAVCDDVRVGPVLDEDNEFGRITFY